MGLEYSRKQRILGPMVARPGNMRGKVPRRLVVPEASPVRHLRADGSVKKETPAYTAGQAADIIGRGARNGTPKGRKRKPRA